MGFGRPETEGFHPASVNTSKLLSFIESSNSERTADMELFVAPESAAYVLAFVELATIAKDFSGFVNDTLKIRPALCLSEMERISRSLDGFSSKWLRARMSSISVPS